MTRFAKIRLGTFALALVLLACGLLAQAQTALAHSGTRLEYVYRRALGDLSDQVAGMELTLEKARYAGTPVMQGALSAQLLEQSGAAKSAMAALPFSQEKTERISRFLSQAGDFALALSRKSFSTGAPGPQDLESLSTLAAYAGKLSAALSDIQARLSAENGRLYDMESLFRQPGGIEALALLDDGFDSVAKEFAGIPALLYDGPFSDHILQREPLALKGRTEITQEQAAREAAAFLQCDPDALTCLGEGGGQLPVFLFSGQEGQVHITQKGGLVAYFKKEYHSAGGLSAHEALEAAAKALDGLGLPPVRESYYVLSDGLCMVNFHTSDWAGGEEALCYPDLIKVVVEMEQGGMVEYDCTGYLMNHHARTLPAPALTQEEAEKSLSPMLTVDSAQLAVIPTPGLDEVLCWEFSCTGQAGRKVLSYINAETGMEEQLYLVQEDEHGVLTV